ncbi:hypothetical protein [Spirillospora sp. NPDC047279]|uniref:hypothetical protein n=1 Tax=Spirillospora sp. NPDC047279 TaxID=3155478 RepID=UPI0033C4A8B7
MTTTPESQARPDPPATPARPPAPPGVPGAGGSGGRHARGRGRRGAGGPGPPPDVREERPGGRLRTFFRARWLGTIPGRIRAYAALGLVAVSVLLVVLSVAIGNARDGVQTIGHDAGPQVVATGSLYFALSDMDAQVANVLLIGRERGLGIGYDEALRRYEARRVDAGNAAVQAAQLAGDNVHMQRTVREVIDGLGRYERLVGEAMLLDRQADHAAGEVPQQVVDTYRQATDLMKMELLPKAYNLTLDSGATVRQAYESKRTAIESGRTWVAFTGALLLAVLVVTQVYLAGRFRRLVNPALALATVVAFVLVAVSVGLLSAQAGHLRKAKEDGFDSILALSRARAISHSAFADESRYLLDPGRADTYEQTYLDKSLAVLFVDPKGKPVTLETYYARLPEVLGTYDPARDRGVFLGLFGEEADGIGPGLETAAFAETLGAYRRVIDNDRRIRELVAKDDRAAAITLRMGRTTGAIKDFDDYDRALVRLTDTHHAAFGTAIRDADGALGGWNAVPLGAAAVIAVLILAGVRPRLAEFR